MALGEQPAGLHPAGLQLACPVRGAQTLRAPQGAAMSGDVVRLSAKNVPATKGLGVERCMMVSPVTSVWLSEAP